MQIRTATIADVDALAEVEAICFSEAEVSSQKIFRQGL